MVKKNSLLVLFPKERPHPYFLSIVLHLILLEQESYRQEGILNHQNYQLVSILS